MGQNQFGSLFVDLFGSENNLHTINLAVPLPSQNISVAANSTNQFINVVVNDATTNIALGLSDIPVVTQPIVSGIADNLWIHGATGTAPSGQAAGNPSNGVFAMISEQINPDVSGGWFQSNPWNAGALTGFIPISPSTAQLGYAASGPTTTVQWEDSTIGVYMQSVDRPNDPAGSKMMITPQLSYLKTTGPVAPTPFFSSNVVLTSSLDLQIPTATGNDVYINMDHDFYGPGGILITFSVELFSNGNESLNINTSEDSNTLSYIISVPLGGSGSSAYITTIEGSYTGNPWSGFKPISYSISYAQFTAALELLQSNYPSAFPTITYITPTQYTLEDVHVNAEFHFNPNGNWTLGWSMTGWTVTLGTTTWSQSGGNYIINGITVPVISPPTITPINNPIGINKFSPLSYFGFPIFKNQARSGRGWTEQSSTENAITYTSYGWPAGDFACVLSDMYGSQSWTSGTWICGFQGTGYEVIGNNGGCTVGNIVANTTGGYTTFTLTFPTSGGGGFIVSNTSGGVTNVFAYLPEYAVSMGNTIDNVMSSSAFTNEAINYFSQFSHMRSMAFQQGVFNGQMGTSANRKTNINCQTATQFPTTVSFTRAPQVGDTGATLTGVWTNSTGVFGLNLGDGNGTIRVSDCTNGCTAVTWSPAITANIGTYAKFTGSIAGTTLNVTNIVEGSGLIVASTYDGSVVTGPSVTVGTAITAQLTGTSGLSGNYSVNVSQTVASETMDVIPGHIFSIATFNIEGYPAEWVISLCNAANIAPWLVLPNIEDGPHYAAGSYCNNLMAMIDTNYNFNGGPAMIEIGDELWNGYQASLTDELASLAGTANVVVYMCEKINAIVNSAIAQFGENFQNFVNIIVPWQAGGNGIYFYEKFLNYYTQQYGPVRNGISAIAVAPYINTSGLTYANFTGNSNNTNLTVSSVNGTINSAGAWLYNGGILANTFIVGQQSGATGGAGVYTISQAQNTVVATMNSAPSVVQIENNLLPIAQNQLWSSNTESIAVYAMHFGIKFISYEGGMQGNSENPLNVNMSNVIMDMNASTVTGSYQNILQQFFQNQFPLFDSWSYFQEGAANSTQGLSIYDVFSNNYQQLITSGSPTLNVLQTYMSGTNLPGRNIVNGSGSFVPGYTYCDNFNGNTTNATIVVKSGSINAPYYGKPYQSWVINCTAPGEYNLIINANNSATVNVETNTGNTGFAIIANNISLVAGNTTTAIPITLNRGKNYICIGNGTTQASCAVKGMWFI